MALMSIDGFLMEEKEAKVSPLSWGCAYGYGLFETILIHRYKPVFLIPHLQRMQASARFLKLAMPQEEELLSWVEQLIQGKNIEDGKLKITLLATERSAGKETYEAKTTITVQKGTPYPTPLYEAGVKIGFLNQIKNEHSPLVKHKTLNYLENMLAREQVREKGWFEGVFTNTKGNVCEGTISNIFLVKNQELITPGIAEGLLPGVTRGIIIDLAKKNNLKVSEREVAPQEMLTAEEVFLTNALLGIMPVSQVADQPMVNGKQGGITKLLTERYRELLSYS